MPSCQAGDLCELALYYFYDFFGEVSLISLLYTMNIEMSASLLLKKTPTCMHLILWSKMFSSVYEIIRVILEVF